MNADMGNEYLINLKKICLKPKNSCLYYDQSQKWPNSPSRDLNINRVYYPVQPTAQLHARSEADQPADTEVGLLTSR